MYCHQNRANTNTYQCIITPLCNNYSDVIIGALYNVLPRKPYQIYLQQRSMGGSLTNRPYSLCWTCAHNWWSASAPRANVFTYDITKLRWWGAYVQYHVPTWTISTYLLMKLIQMITKSCWSKMSDYMKDNNSAL